MYNSNAKNSYCSVVKIIVACIEQHSIKSVGSNEVLRSVFVPLIKFNEEKAGKQGRPSCSNLRVCNHDLKYKVYTEAVLWCLPETKTKNCNLK